MKKIFFDQSCTEADKALLDNIDSIYHFTKCDKAIEYILQERKLKISKFATTNDPVEYKRRIFGAGYTGDWPQGFSDRLFQYNIAINELFKNNTLFISTCMNTFNKIDSVESSSQFGS